MIASVIAVLQLAAAATQYVKDVKSGAADRVRLRHEMRSTVCLLVMLKDRVEDSEDCGEQALEPASIQSLASPDGPLAQFKKLLEGIVAKLAPQDRLRRLAQPFTWPFHKKDTAEMLTALERLKSHFGLVLQNNILSVIYVTRQRDRGC